MSLAVAEPTIAERLRDGSGRLAEAGIENPRLESRLLLAHALDCSPEAVIRDLRAAPEAPAFDPLIARRAAHEPLAFILGWREFWSLRFQVSPATLIPRPDSETLVAAALALCPSGGPVRVLDLGCGTGCLLLAFLHERPAAFGIGVDRSEPAARLAALNARVLGLSGRSAFLRGDWAGAVGGRFDLVLSNPPYIAAGDLASLAPDVAMHEPRAALDGGRDGLDSYRAILAALPDRLVPGGVAVLELGLGQAGAVGRIASEAGFSVDFRTDLAGIARAIILRPLPLKIPIGTTI